MKKLYIHGSFMNDNFGDYLLFEKILSVCEQYKSSYEIYSSNVDAFYRKWTDFKEIPLDKAVKDADCIILAGGGYLGEPPTFKLLWNYNFRKNHAIPLMQAVADKKCICVVGVGFGPLSFFVSRKCALKILSVAQYVSVRDRESKDYLLRYGFGKKVMMNPDWILSCAEIELTQGIQCKPDYCDSIIIHLTSNKNRMRRLFSIVFNDIIDYCKYHSSKVLIITDQARESQIERAHQSQKWLELLQPNVYIYNNPHELCSIIKNASCVITDKLHVGIVASRFQIPVISLPAHKKTERFYRQIGMYEHCHPIRKIKKGVVFSELTNARKGHFYDNNTKLSNAMKAAENNVKIVQKFLEDNR